MWKNTQLRISRLSLLIVLIAGYGVAQELAPAIQLSKKNTAPVLLASLRPSQELLWQRVSPSTEEPDGPVLYQIIFRSSATPNSIPKISNSFTLTNSLLSESGSTITINGNATMSGFRLTTGASSGWVLTSDGFGNGTWQLAPGTGTVTSVATSTGLTGGTITTTGTISIANGGVTTTQIGSGAATNGQVLTANGSGAVSWQMLTPAITNGWGLTGNSGTGCTTSPCADFVGSTDNDNLEFRVNNQRAFRIESAISATTGTFTPNIIGSFSGNTVTPGVGGATIAGGGAASGLNRVTDDFGTIGGGSNNQAGDNAGTTSDRPYATVGGGGSNTASAGYSTVGGGFGNSATGGIATVGGGDVNTASGSDSTVAGGTNNAASGEISTVAGGLQNTASGVRSTIAGGELNTASKTYATVGGGVGNTASGAASTVAGGGTTGSSTATANRALDDFSTVGGGGNNQAGNGTGSKFATVAGGNSNTASGFGGAIAGGETNTASGQDSSVTGGLNNNATGDWSVVAGGNANTSSGTNSFVAAGSGNVAGGLDSFAGGSNAHASHLYSFVWCDGESTPCGDPVDKSFAVVADGGFYFYVGPAGHGCVLQDSSNAQWGCSSDRNLKENFEELDKRSLLERVVAMPVTRWNFKGSRPGIKHIGPMSQDFYAAFHLSENEKYIGTTDIAGVTLAAIQGLNQKLEEELKQKDEEIARAHEQLSLQQHQIEAQQQQLEALQKQMRAITVRVEAVEQGTAHARASLVASSQ